MTTKRNEGCEADKFKLSTLPLEAPERDTVRVVWRDPQGRRCTAWRSSQELGKLIEAEIGAKG